MDNSIAKESGLEFDFHLPYERADTPNCFGLKAVDFIVKGDDNLYFIEVKNFEHPNAPEENRKYDYKMLTEKDSYFPREMGIKIKDSLLRQYALGKTFPKDIIFILIIKLNSFTGHEREKLYRRFNGHIPTGLNGYPAFSNLSFEMPRIDELKNKYGFDVRVL
jgi:hypothetical protein